MLSRNLLCVTEHTRPPGRRVPLRPAVLPFIQHRAGRAGGCFQRRTAGGLWYYRTERSGDTGLGMMSGTSPSISNAPDGWAVAYQANTTDLWVVNSDGTGPGDTGQTMMPGTSPAEEPDNRVRRRGGVDCGM